MTRINRRQALALLSSTALSTACATQGAPEAMDTSASFTDPDIFRHGVASGDPETTSVVIWTRVSTGSPIVDVTWAIYEDPEGNSLIASGSHQASADSDYTVKVIADGLQPGQTYYYRFEAEGEVSRTGRTRTLPVGALDSLGIALVSCSNYPFGYFNAYDAIAHDPAIDIVLHTGDYIYEYGGPDGWGQETGAVIGRPHNPPHEIITLADYRQRHAQYKQDAGSRAMHAMHPLICCWDDHESANNPWTGGAQNHQPETEGSWEDRRAASIQAYYEWMPIREPKAGRTRAQFWRSYMFGDLATLLTLETRHTARGKQVDYAEWAPKLNTEEDYEAFRKDVLGDPERHMISPTELTDISEALSSSVAKRQPWRVIGNQIPMARTLVPDVVGLGVLPVPDEASLEAHKRLAWLGQHALPFYTDTWDGYPAAREVFYDTCKASGASDLLVLTGDSHSFWANHLHDGSGTSMGIELGTSGVTSPGDFVESGFDDETARSLDKAFSDYVPEVVWTDNMHQGYVRVVLQTDVAEASFVAVSTVLRPVYEARSIKNFTIRKDTASLSLQEA
ncbi:MULTISPECIES: alkaline phosphatase [unclassified Hyphomonas]|jgi:alkaline phosphatase D|uniref:alkaline phosphatase D family protein n=1 Tax=unclassified Hyphomonas TaxID=2630699 RepID=UPI00054EBF94|nr:MULTISPECIES: alkaline phosphatase D family protein [unclassified Hyphomonas]